MHAASISYNDAMWEFYQILKEKSHIRKQQQHGLSAAISRSGMFPSTRTHDDDDYSSRSGGDDDDNSSRGGGDMDMGVQQEYDDDYYNPYSDSPRRGDYDHEEEAS
jgi:hypothetical protein